MILQFLGWFFRQKGWKLSPTIPLHIRQCVIIAAPHTSNWDFVYAMGALHLFGIPVRYLAKKELFTFPLSWVLRSTGGIPIDRSKRAGMVDAAILEFKQQPNLMLMIAGEGTRGKVTRWKSGFYHVAIGAEVPLLLAYLDYPKKEAGFSPPIYLTGEKEKDITAIRNFYTDKTGRHPDLFSLETIQW